MKRFEGKLFGAALGFSFGGPIGAIIGAAVGHLFDSSLSKRVIERGKYSEKELTFVTSLVLLLVGTAKADGRITQEEIQTIKSFFKQQLRYSYNELMFIERIIQEAINSDLDLYEACNSIRQNTEYEERLFLIRLNYQIAVSDGHLSPEEEEFIRKSSEHLRIEQYDYVAIRNSFSSYRAKSSSGSAPPSMRAKQDPYTLLGLRRSSTTEEVQKAYRNLANKYHPDKVNHLGKEFIDLATKKFTQIQQAYDTIKSERGFA